LLVESNRYLDQRHALLLSRRKKVRRMRFPLSRFVSCVTLVAMAVTVWTVLTFVAR